MIGKEVKKNSKVNRPNDIPLGKKTIFNPVFLQHLSLGFGIVNN